MRVGEARTSTAVGKISFLTPVVSQTTFHKRIRGLTAQGAEAIVFSFERDYYRGDVADGTIVLGRVERGKYLKRIWPMCKALRTVRQRANSSDVVYAFGLDMLVLGWLALIGVRERPVYAYEVADIRTILVGSGLVPSFCRQVERIMLRKIKLLVVTSEAYVDGYYKGMLSVKLPQTMVVENKLEAFSHVNNPHEQSTVRENSPVRIGYFGLIRCRKSLEVLSMLLDRYPGRYSVVVRGINFGLGDLFDDFIERPDVHYGGPFRSPDDLSDMYGMVDMAWIAQSHAKTNTMWARTNRYYEACLFAKPMIAQKGTQDVENVVSRDLGLSIDMNHPHEAVMALGSLDPSEINRWAANARKLPTEVHTYTDEHSKLYNVLGRYS